MATYFSRNWNTDFWSIALWGGWNETKRKTKEGVDKLQKRNMETLGLLEEVKQDRECWRNLIKGQFSP